MLRNLFIKEWKERLPILFFSLAVLLVFTGSFLGLAGNKEALDFLTGAVTLVFLPVFGLLLGSSGFYSEFKDGAWAYLFSRPVKKRQIWLAKYLSLLSILLAVAIVFASIVEILPGVKDVLADLSFTLRFGRQFSLFTLGLIWSLIFLTTSFALAIFSDKPHIIVFLALLLWVAPYAVFVLVYSSFLQVWLYRVSVFQVLFAVGLLCLSLALASVFTFSQADFSQPKKKVWHFIRLAAVLIAASCVISAGIIMASFRTGRFFHISDLRISEGAVFFHSGKGIYRYDLDSQRLQRIKKIYPWGPLSVGGGRIVFVKEVLQSRNRMSEELWTIDADGRNARPLIETSREGGPFYDLLIWGTEVSDDGRTVVFLAKDSRDQHMFYWMNRDGSDIRSLPLGMPNIRYFRLAGFSDSARYVLLHCVPQAKTAESGASLLKVDLDRAAVEILATNVRRPHLAALSGKGLAAYIAFDETTGKEVLFLQDLRTGEKREALAADSIAAFIWTGPGDKLAIWTGKATLSIYSLAEKRVVIERNMKGYEIRLPLVALDGGTGGSRLVLCRAEQGRKLVSVLNDELNEVQAIPFPWAAGDGLRLEASGKVVFAWEYDQPRLWSVDLDTAKWRRIY